MGQFGGGVGGRAGGKAVVNAGRMGSDVNVD